MSLGSTSGMAAKMSALMPTFSGSFALLKFLNAPGYMRMSCRLRATTAAACCCLSEAVVMVSVLVSPARADFCQTSIEASASFGFQLGNVNYVLEGSVQRGADRLRVNVQLVDEE